MSLASDIAKDGDAEAILEISQNSRFVVAIQRDLLRDK